MSHSASFYINMARMNLGVKIIKHRLFENCQMMSWQRS